MIDISQLAILLTGAVAIWMTQQSNTELKRYACFFGLIGQPFWLYETFTSDQIGMFLLSIFYTFSWILGIKNNWCDGVHRKNQE
jgi:hypothetical protein